MSWPNIRWPGLRVWLTHPMWPGFGLAAIGVLGILTLVAMVVSLVGAWLAPMMLGVLWALSRPKGGEEVTR